jgi:serine protease AprX
MLRDRTTSSPWRHCPTIVLLAAGLVAPTAARADSNQSADTKDPVGNWRSVDFVRSPEDFKPGTRQYQDDLFLKEFQFFKNGRTSLDWTWKQDYITHTNGRTRARYYIKTIDGTDYLFLPWLSGDVTVLGRKPSYYVLTRSAAQTQTARPESLRPARSESFQTVRPIKSVRRYDDVRWKDMSALDLSRRGSLPATLTFNENTIWPPADKMPAGCDPKKLMVAAMNPGLGIRELHKQGITGKGVNVAIIDQPLYHDHPEFKGKIAAYHDVGARGKFSMHGPGVASLLVGSRCGTAPDARVYFVAHPTNKPDAAPLAEGLRWIIEQNDKLPAGQKIRVVSVSAAPSGPGSPFKENNDQWDAACTAAERAGILVLDCTMHHGFIGPCWYDIEDRDNVAKCRPGFPGRRSRPLPDRLLVPCSPRTTAEQYDEDQYSYQYCGRGGLSWSIPYCAGVLALGWQLRPDLPPETMRELLFESAYTTKRGDKIIHPAQFIKRVRDAKPPTD